MAIIIHRIVPTRAMPCMIFFGIRNPTGGRVESNRIDIEMPGGGHKSEEGQVTDGRMAVRSAIMDEMARGLITTGVGGCRAGERMEPRRARRSLAHGFLVARSHEVRAGWPPCGAVPR